MPENYKKMKAVHAIGQQTSWSFKPHFMVAIFLFFSFYPVNAFLTPSRTGSLLQHPPVTTTPLIVSPPASENISPIPPKAIANSSSDSDESKIIKFINKNFFLLGMILAVSLSSTIPSIGADGSFLRPEIIIKKFGVSAIFFLSGVSLGIGEIKEAVTNHFLNFAVQLSSFVLWPYGIGLPLVSLLQRLQLLNAPLRDGILIMSTLPTTVNMCVILSASAGGNVASALCNAVYGNLLGIFITPAMLFRFFGTKISLPFMDMVSKLIVKVLFPVLLGQLLRIIALKGFYDEHKNFFKRFQEIVLLSIAWNAFSNAFLKGFGLDLTSSISLLAIIPTIHIVSLILLFALFSFLKFNRSQVISAMFCGSHKTLAFGLPLIQTIFDGSPELASYCAPLMFIHPIQLMIGSLIVPWLKEYASEEKV